MISKIKHIIIIALLLSSCGDPASDGRELTRHPGYEYMPNMYRSPSFETYEPNAIFSDNSSARQPVKGTIPRGGYVPFEYENTIDDYLRAGNELINPLEKSEDNLESGKSLYGMYCAHCHGKKGDGKGSITHPLYSGVPSYSDELLVRRTGGTMNKLKDGNIYHSIYYGLNAMGPHASLVNEEERWKIIMYVNQLQKGEN